MVKKAPSAFRTISEVADWLELPTHVLRFWESKIKEVAPVKRSGGRRYYRPEDMLLLGGIKCLLHDEGLTIRALNKKIENDGVLGISTYSQPLGFGEDRPFKSNTQGRNKTKSTPTSLNNIVSESTENHYQPLTNLSTLKSKIIIMKKLRSNKILKTTNSIALTEWAQKLSKKRDKLAKHLFFASKNNFY
ncbi:MAG: MerR family transcriptional regulator [Paracoccaceae bacterium]